MSAQKVFFYLGKLGDAVTAVQKVIEGGEILPIGSIIAGAEAVFLHMEKHNDPANEPFVFDGPAEEAHIQQFKAEFKAFLEKEWENLNEYLKEKYAAHDPAIEAAKLEELKNADAESPES